MAALNGPLGADGAVLDVRVGWTRSAIRVLRVQGKPIPQPLIARAVIDSGAEITCLDASLVRRLGFPFRGPLPVNAPGLVGLSYSPHNDVDLTILHPSGRSFVCDNRFCDNLARGGLGLALDWLLCL